MKHRYLTPEELKQIRHEKDMIEGDINRMCITDDSYELMNVFMSANKSLKHIHDICVKRFIVDRDKKCNDECNMLDKIKEEIESHRRKTESIDPYDLVGDCLDIIAKYTEKETHNNDNNF